MQNIVQSCREESLPATLRQSAATPLAPRSTPQLFSLVGIGASAADQELLALFRRHMPADSGLALVIVQHRDRASANWEVGVPRVRTRANPPRSPSPAGVR